MSARPSALAVAEAVNPFRHRSPTLRSSRNPRPRSACRGSAPAAAAGSPGAPRSSQFTVTLSKNASTGPRKPRKRRHRAGEILARRAPSALGRAPRPGARPSSALLGRLEQLRIGRAGDRRRRPSSPRCGRCWRRGDRRRADWRRPRCRGSAAAPRPAPAAARDRPRRPPRTPRRPDRAARPARADATFRRSAKKASRSAVGSCRRSPMRERGAEHRAQRQAQLVLEDDADHAQRGAAQREGVPRAGRLLADGEEADQRVDLVGQRHGDADRRGRAAVVGPERRVMLGDRVGDCRRLAVMERVVAAHDALQLGELADHAGREIGLGQPRRAPALRGIGAGSCGAIVVGQLRDALDLVEHACRAWRGRRARRASATRLSSGSLRSWSQKNLASDSRARSTRSLPATIALPPSSATMLATTRKCGASLPSRVEAGEIFLVRAHRGGQHLGRHVHELRIDACPSAPPAIRPGRDLVQQPVVRLQRRGRARRPRCSSRSAMMRCALVGVEHDMGGAQLVA